MIYSGILPREKTVAAEGLSYLKTIPSGTYDMVTAFMFLPPGIYISDFYAEASRAIKPDGRIIMTSDSMRMIAIDDEVGRYGKIFKPATGDALNIFVGRKIRT